MKLAQLVEVWSALRKTRSRNEKTTLLADLLRAASPREVGIVVSYLSGRLRQGKIGLGYAAVRDAAEELPPPDEGGLSIDQVDRTFDTIAAQHGKGSATERHRLLVSMLSSVSEEGRRFLARLILGELRQGASEGLMCEAIAKASSVSAEEVRRAFMLSGDLPRVTEAAIARGESGLREIKVTLFVPLRPMLAQPTDDIQTALETLGDALFEYKLDGARIQAHKRGSEVRVYSRALNEVTRSLPEVVDVVQRLSADSLILDGEALAFRPDGRPHPFQTTMRRFGRRRDVDALRRELPLSVYFFDLLYLDDESLIDEPLRHRLARMDGLLSDEARPMAVVTREPEDAEALWSRAMDAGHEGLMAKALGSSYEAGNRGARWLKIKPAHTLDLVIIGAEWGSGRRKGWLSNLHLAAYDAERDDFVMLGKTFKGLTDALLDWQTKELLARETGREDHVVHVEPALVVEIAFNDVQESPRYPGGLALRFARVKRYRPDKSPREADVIETVREIFAKSTA
jgi:DNA ligase-1